MMPRKDSTHRALQSTKPPPKTIENKPQLREKLFLLEFLYVTQPSLQIRAEFLLAALSATANTDQGPSRVAALLFPTARANTRWDALRFSNERGSTPVVTQHQSKTEKGGRIVFVVGAFSSIGHEKFGCVLNTNVHAEIVSGADDFFMMKTNQSNRRRSPPD
jgi:hypothetical protein